MATNFDKVVEFNKTFGLPHYDTRQNNLFDSDPKLVNLRYSLIEEEIGELNDAYVTHDFIEVIDALTDILYVVYGAASSFGYDINDCYFELRDDKVISKTLFENCQEDVVEQYEGERDRFYESETGNDYLNILKNLLSELKISIENKEYNNFVRLSVEILDFTYRLGHFYKIDLNMSFDIVHSSNMSKVCKDEAEAEETVLWYRDNETRYDSPDYRLSDDKTRYIVYNQSTGKILKSINYVAAKFDSMIK